VKKRALETLHGELRSGMNQDDLGVVPNFAEEEEELSLDRKVADRRIVHRRRPRSKSVRSSSPLVAAQAA